MTPLRRSLVICVFTAVIAVTADGVASAQTSVREGTIAEFSDRDPVATTVSPDDFAPSSIDPAVILAAPTKIAFQGFLKGPGGQPVNGTVVLTISLYGCSSCGTVLWTETQSNVSVVNGVFQVPLGATTPLTPAHFSATPRYIGVSVNFETELLPRVELFSSPFAFRASMADSAVALASGSAVTSLNGLTNSVSLVAGPNVSIVPSGNNLTISATGTGGGDNDWTVSGNNMWSNVTGNVGVGTAAPLQKLHVSGGTGSVQMLLEADTNNAGEGDQPLFKMTQDGGLVEGAVGFTQSTNDLKLFLNDQGDSTTLTLESANDNIITNSDLLVGGGATNFDSGHEVIDINAQSKSWRLGVINATNAGASPFFITQGSNPDGAFQMDPNGDVDLHSLHADAGGNVGINTISPTAKLHVNGGINVGSATTDGSVSIVSTGLGSFANLDMNNSGNAAVQFSPDAISAPEILDEPGVAASQANEVEDSIQGATVIKSRTLDLPAPGYVIAIATAEMNANRFIVMDVYDADTGYPWDDGYALDDHGGSLLGDDISVPVSIHKTFSYASAGPRTFYFIVDALESGDSAVNPRLTLLYVPSAYGTVSDPAASPQLDEVDGDRTAAAHFTQDRLERELADMRTQVEELRRKVDGSALEK